MISSLNNQELQYALQFQNTGNDTAHNVFILDTLDADLDLLSLQIIGNSHPMTVDILSGNVLKFNFDNIMLPDSNVDEQHSHGFVSYRIYPKNNLANGTQLTNTAYIYFDFNLPVVTNTTLNTIDLFLSVPKISETENSFQLFPNPANDQLTIHTTGNNFHSELTMYDFLGKEIFRKNILKNDEVIDSKKFPAGIYSARLSNERNSFVRKIIILH